MADQELYPQPVRFEYINYKGERSQRHALPLKLWYGTTEHHPTESWFMRAWDFDRSAIRDFAMRDIMNWRHSIGPSTSGAVIQLDRAQKVQAIVSVIAAVSDAELKAGTNTEIAEKILAAIERVA